MSMEGEPSHPGGGERQLQSPDDQLVRNAEELMNRSAKLCEELEMLRLAVEKEAAKANNHWHAHIPGFSTFWQSNAHQNTRAASLLHRTRDEPVEAGSELEGSLQRDFRLLEGEIASYENHWAAIKKCHSITWFRFAIKPEGSRNSVFVSAIVENGHEWLRVLSTAERALLVQMAEADFPWDEPDQDGEDTELKDVLGDDDSQIEVVKSARQLLAAAHEIHGGYQHRIRIILPNISRGKEPAIDRLLRGLESLGDESFSVVLECVEDTRQMPPPVDEAIQNLLSHGNIANTPPLTPVLNVDTSILVAMTTDISHEHGDQRRWRPKILEDVADEAENGPRLIKSLYPKTRGHTLVCTREAADTCLRMVYDASTDAEIARVEILLGQETRRGKADDKMGFLNRILDQSHWPPVGYADAISEARRQRLIAELAKLSCHEVPEDLQLPIRIIEDFRREHIPQEVAKGTLPRVALLVEPTLNDTNASSFMFGWKTRNTTITCNRHAVRKLGNLVQKLRWSRDAELAPIIALDWARGLAKLPFPGEVLVKAPPRSETLS